MEKEQASQPTVAALYQRCVLDPIVELALSISHDSVRPTRQYRSLPRTVAELLEGFRDRTGSASEWLSATQRRNLFSPIFATPFWDCSGEVRSAAVAYAELGGGNSQALLGAVRDTAATLRGYLQSLEAGAVADAENRTGPVFRNAIEVFRDGAVAAAFGLPAAPGGMWPLDGGVTGDATSSNGAHLIQVIQTALDPLHTRPSMSQYRFIHLQRAARYGAMTISGVLDGVDDLDSGEQIQSLVYNLYGWEKALEALFPLIDVVRVWKDPRYRHGLSACERAMISPHPSGEVDLKDAKLDPMAAQQSIESKFRVFSTRTYLEICCSTGDLCPTITRDYCGTSSGFTCSSTGDNLTCINCEVD